MDRGWSLYSFLLPPYSHCLFFPTVEQRARLQVQTIPCSGSVKEFHTFPSSAAEVPEGWKQIPLGCCYLAHCIHSMEPCQPCWQLSSALFKGGWEICHILQKNRANNSLGCGCGLFSLISTKKKKPWNIIFLLFCFPLICEWFLVLASLTYKLSSSPEHSRVWTPVVFGVVNCLGHVPCSALAMSGPGGLEVLVCSAHSSEDAPF